MTYNSHKARTGTGLGLYRIDSELRPQLGHVHEGTHANRLVRKESNQVFIGPYAFDLRGNFRFIEPLADHRLTATIRHLQDPANRAYVVTTEGLLFELEVDSLKPRLLFDLTKMFNIARPHFKGGCTAQGRLVVANNSFYRYGDREGGLFEWDGKQWRVLSRLPHVECAARENLGSVMFCTGWDEASAILWALVEGDWQRYRLPKASHTFEHAWQTEWMRIREVETERFLMDLHGMFYELQPIAWEGRIWGIKPICQHLRVIPDFCAFRGLLALGGNQTTPNADNNPVAGQPQSGVWFCKTDDLWSWGKPQGWGGPWRNSEVQPGQPSEPFLMTGFEHKVLQLMTRTASAVDVTVEIDFVGNGQWVEYERFSLSPSKSYVYHVFPTGFSAHWVRLIPNKAAVLTAQFVYI